MGNLTARTTTEMIENHFARYGKIVDAVHIHQDGKPKHFGFVHFARDCDARAALADTHKLDGQDINLGKAEARDSPKLAGRSASAATSAPANSRATYTSHATSSATRLRSRSPRRLEQRSERRQPAPNSARPLQQRPNARPGADALSRQVDDFISRHKIDESAAKTFRAASTEVQRRALADSELDKSLADARNPSSMLNSKLKTIMSAPRPQDLNRNAAG